MTDRTFLVLGGAGMVGFEVAHQVANSLRPGARRAGLAARRRRWPRPWSACAAWSRPTWRSSGSGATSSCGRSSPTGPRRELFEDEACRRAIFDDLFGPLDAAYERSRLARLIAAYRPDVVIDAVNTATAISYQDVYTAAVLAERDVDEPGRGARAWPRSSWPATWRRSSSPCRCRNWCAT